MESNAVSEDEDKDQIDESSGVDRTPDGQSTDVKQAGVIFSLEIIDAINKLTKIANDLNAEKGLGGFLVFPVQLHAAFLVPLATLADPNCQIIVTPSSDHVGLSKIGLLLFIRSYITALQVYFEAGLISFFKGRNLEVTSALKTQWEQAVKEAEGKRGKSAGRGAFLACPGSTRCDSLRMCSRHSRFPS
jgi:hypothetical protein